MDTTDFIESGILESYLLGLSNEEEREYVKQRILTDQEVSDYLVDLETDIKGYFDQHSFPPPPEVREIIALRTSKGDIQKKKHVFNKNSAQENTRKKDEYLEIEVNDTYIKVHKYWRPAFIAVFILSKIFLIAGLYYYFKTASLEQELVKLKTEVQQLK
ncbi:hypothetical protein [Dyadobacter psychrotolerans]|uniref:Anti-sigma factor n=1 Tax=Dyadobacter psychrotolerans TaxID=2541721 RepID=A0A4R5DR02_9BACT|nr:hypothetical protein [Dyadobacter psychrotolerans]TDE16729.1 hypothetical protein E0F88_10905 [Dyadobacter psychrotolerans]